MTKRTNTREHRNKRTRQQSQCNKVWWGEAWGQENNIRNNTKWVAIAPHLTFSQRKLKDKRQENRIIWCANLHPTRAPCKGRETKGQEDKINKVQENKRSRLQKENSTTTTENTMTIQTKDTEAENRRTREQIIKERIQETTGTRGNIMRSSLGCFSPQDISSERS